MSASSATEAAGALLSLQSLLQLRPKEDAREIQEEKLLIIKINKEDMSCWSVCLLVSLAVAALASTTS